MERPVTTSYTVPDGPKMLRETLCVAAGVIGRAPDDGRKREHVDRLQRLINECDRHRPIGPNGKHGDRHTLTCGCEDVLPEPPMPGWPTSPEQARARELAFRLIEQLADDADVAAASGVDRELNTYLAGSLRMRAAFVRAGVIAPVNRHRPGRA
jgi:hypothetical protein